MKQIFAVSAALLLALFLIPLLAATQVPEELTGPESIPSERQASPSAEVSPSPVRPSAAPASSDAGRIITVLVGGSVQDMPLRDFIAGAVAAEMPALYPAEALRAQAVAIRTLAAYAEAHPYHGSALLCDNWECCLAYTPLESNTGLWGEAYEEYAAAVGAAVDDTDGVIILYEGEPIEAVYFAASDGRTKSAAEVWGGEIPYLQGVESAFDLEFPDGPKGHGVGLSQFGARQLALQGYTYVEILRWYYTGIEIGRY